MKYVVNPKIQIVQALNVDSRSIFKDLKMLRSFFVQVVIINQVSPYICYNFVFVYMNAQKI